MKDMSQLWQNAGQVVVRAVKAADARVNGTPRARALYGQLSEPERAAMAGVVRDRFGETAWQDFIKEVEAPMIGDSRQ